MILYIRTSIIRALSLLILISPPKESRAADPLSAAMIAAAAAAAATAYFFPKKTNATTLINNQSKLPQIASPETNIPLPKIIYPEIEILHSESSPDLQNTRDLNINIKKIKRIKGVALAETLIPAGIGIVEWIGGGIVCGGAAYGLGKQLGKKNFVGDPATGFNGDIRVKTTPCYGRPSNTGGSTSKVNDQSSYQPSANDNSQGKDKVFYTPEELREFEKEQNRKYAEEEKKREKEREKKNAEEWEQWKRDKKNKPPKKDDDDKRKLPEAIKGAKELADDIAERSRKQTLEETRRLTNKDARELVKEHLKGYEEKPNSPFDTHGGIAFYNKKTKTWISPDQDGHNGGVWKMFNRSGDERLGTFNDLLTKRIKS